MGYRHGGPSLVARGSRDGDSVLGGTSCPSARLQKIALSRIELACRIVDVLLVDVRDRHEHDPEHRANQKSGSLAEQLETATILCP